ncbi:MAG: hypothetical protein IJT21_11025 [Synergistaceae bacterium]|nr:hypothetical protein [Synergistaceae bacterium]
MSESEYVRKDLYDSNMQEIRALMAASEARHEKIAAEIRVVNAENLARHEKIAAEMKSDYKVMSIRLDNMENTINFIMQRLNFLIAGLTLGFTILSMLIAFMK